MMTNNIQKTFVNHYILVILSLLKFCVIYVYFGVLRLQKSFKVVIFIAFLFISSCVNHLQDLVSREKELKERRNFNGYLSLEYLQYSRDLANKYSWVDSEYFAMKGIEASRNKQVFPEVPENWYLDNSQIEQATLARKKLIILLFNFKAQKELPIQLAHLQLLYDCWISREKESWQLASMAKCKILFFRLEDEISKYLKDKKSKEEIKIITIKKPEFTKFDIYFDLDLYKFSSRANKSFVGLFEYLESLNGDYQILLVGNADRMGKELYNDVLARKRSLIVKNRLIKNGVPSSIITIKSLGERNPDIITKNGDKNHNNRRVSVYVLKGQDNISEIPLPLIDNYIYKQDIIKFRKKKGY